MLPSFAEVDVDEIFSAAAGHLLDRLGQSLDAGKAKRPRSRKVSKR